MTQPSDDHEYPSFEHALTELQQIVAGLEDGTLGLDEAMRQFERGTRLLRYCYAILEQAEQKIEVLTGFDADGNPVTREFDASASHDPERAAAGRRRRKSADDTADPGESADSRLF